MVLVICGCRSSQSTVQIDRPSVSVAKSETVIKRDQAEINKENQTLIKQTSAETSVPIQSELDQQKDKSLMKSNPISKLIGKFNNKPKRIPLPRTDLTQEGEESFSETTLEQEEGIPAEDISF